MTIENGEDIVMGAGSVDFDAPIVVRAADSVTLRLDLNGRPLIVTRISTGGDPFSTITHLRLVVQGRFFDEDRMLAEDIRPWSSVEEIAAFVAGDGTDSQRVALADGIRVGWAKGARIKVGDE